MQILFETTQHNRKSNQVKRKNFSRATLSFMDAMKIRNNNPWKLKKTSHQIRCNEFDRGDHPFEPTRNMPHSEAIRYYNVTDSSCRKVLPKSKFVKPMLNKF